MSQPVAVPVAAPSPVQLGGGTSMLRKILWLALGALALYFLYTRFVKKKEPEAPVQQQPPQGMMGGQPTPEQLEQMAMQQQMEEQQYMQAMQAQQAAMQQQAMAQQAAMQQQQQQQQGGQGPPEHGQGQPPQPQQMPPRPAVQ